METFIYVTALGHTVLFLILYAGMLRSMLLLLYTLHIAGLLYSHAQNERLRAEASRAEIKLST